MRNSIDIFPWNDSFCTGLEQVDSQHRRLVELLNQLASQVAFQTEGNSVGRIFDELADYARYHFETEEAIWAVHLAGEALEIEHRAVHRSFGETVAGLREALGERPVEEVAEEALGFLARWLASHILENDRYMAYVIAAMADGTPLAAAQAQAAQRMSGDAKILIGIILSIYDTLSVNTLRLMREIAERKKREVELVQARLQAEAANFAKSRFFDNISHALRTPLNGIMGVAQLLGDGTNTAEEREEFRQLILDSGRELLALVDGLIALSEAESGQLALDGLPFEPATLLREVQEQHAAAAAAKGLTLALQVGELPVGSCVGDVHRLRQMLCNLLSNALKFTHHGSIRLGVRQTRADEEGIHLEFSVADTGIGIDPAHVACLFQPFSQLDQAGRRYCNGSGVGLSIVRSLAELMGGQVGVESAPGAGSRFWFTVCVRPVAA